MKSTAKETRSSPAGVAAHGPVEVSVVLPCLNEAGSVGRCVARARRALGLAGLSHEVIVADNGSSDDSVLEAREAGARVVTETRRGYGAALRAGIEESRGRVVVVADADQTYPLEQIPVLVDLVRLRGGLVLGSRFQGSILPGAMPWLHRMVGTPITRVVLRALYRVRCKDPHSGMRAFTRHSFTAVAPASSGMEFAIEMIINAASLSFPITEVPITYSPRLGHSKLSCLSDGYRLLRFLFTYRRAMRRAGTFGRSPVSLRAGGSRGGAVMTFGLDRAPRDADAGSRAPKPVIP